MFGNAETAIRLSASWFCPTLAVADSQFARLPRSCSHLAQRLPEFRSCLQAWTSVSSRLSRSCVPSAVT